jgi:hypothetical protein
MIATAKEEVMMKRHPTIPDDIVREPRELTDEEIEQVVGGKGTSEFHITKYLDKASPILFQGP